MDISNRLVCFDIKGLGKNLKKPGMLIVQDAVWNTVTINRAIGRSTWYFVDEFHPPAEGGADGGLFGGDLETV